MKILKIVVILLFFVVLHASLIYPADAKILSKDLVDKADLSYGIKTSLCEINIGAQGSQIANDSEVTSYESSFFKNPASYQCIGDQQTMIFGQVSLYFKKVDNESISNKGIENIILFNDKIYRLDSTGYFYYEDGSAGGSFSRGDIIKGLQYVKARTLHLTDPNLPGGQEMTKNSGITIYYTSDGDIGGILFILNGKVYKVKKIEKEVHNIPLIDYTQDTETTIPTDWKMYTNTQFGYSMQYPPSWNYVENESIFFSPTEIKFMEGPAAPIEISIEKNTTIEKVAEVIQKSEQHESFTMEPFLIGLVPAVKVSGILGEGYLARTYESNILIPIRSDVIQVRFFGQPSVSQQEFEKIVKTFRLTNKQPVFDTSNWKTVVSQYYGYYIDYPPEWTVTETNSQLTFYPKGVTAGMWERRKNPTPGIEPQIDIAVLNKPFSQSMAITTNKSDFYTKPQAITVDGNQGYYYQPIGAPISPFTVDLPYDNGDKILQFMLIPAGKENVDQYNQEENTNIQDIDEETFKQVVSTFKMSKVVK